jgi:hypothetical protein
MKIDNQENFITYCKQDINQVINCRVGSKYSNTQILVVKNFITRLKKDDLAHVIWDKEMVE